MSYEPKIGDRVFVLGTVEKSAAHDKTALVRFPGDLGNSEWIDWGVLSPTMPADRKRRERIATACLQGVLASNRFGTDLASAVWEGINAADALIAELDKERG